MNLYKKTYNKGISVVVPVLNEAGNISMLLKRIHAAMKKTAYKYEVIIIDDHSTDSTMEVVKSNEKKYPIRYFTKQGIIGKAQSLLEGFSYAEYDILCMIDSDLQYPPEVLPEMLQKMNDGYDVVVTKRTEKHTSFLRKFFSNSFNFIFCRLLHGLSYDVQSGFKIFRKEIIERVTIRPLPWSFDLEFLLAARSAGYHITSIDIIFEKRINGKSKVNIIWTSLQIGLSAIILKLKPEQIIPFHATKIKKVGAGFNYKKTEFVHFSDLQLKESAVVTILGHQALMITLMLIIFLAGLAYNWTKTLTIFVGIITVVYFLDLLFNLYLIMRSLIKSPEIEISEEELNVEREWPRYTIFCPLYKEWSVVDQFVDSIGALDYPKDKIQVQMLLEEDDRDTIDHVKSYPLPKYFEVIIVPHTLPKTKPKACNYGLRYATGEYAVIYDAEDLPEKSQIKKAVLAFEKSNPNIVCIQAKLNYYNRSQNLLTRLFTAEYSLWFDLILPGLQSMNAIIPLGGTSNHFKVERLREVKGWDSFNVTEDCDLGIRLAKKGYLTAMVASDTLEEANSDLFNWINQRSRWIKGYMQTYLVHMRNPIEFLKSKERAHFFTFQLVVGGKILSLIINPIMWVTTVLYFTIRAVVGPAIEQFFPGIIFYIAVLSLVCGNFLYIYYYMIGCAKRKQFELIKFVYLVPLYWLAMSFATWKALFQLIVKPHYWQKTKHGLHLKRKTEYSQVQYQNDIPQQVEGVSSSNKMKNLFFSGGVLVMAGVLANFMNYLYSGYLSRTLHLSEFGLISLVSNFLFITIIPLESLSSSIVYRSAFYLGKYKKSLTQFWSKTRTRAFIISIAAAAVWVLVTPWLAKFFKTDNLLPFYLFTPIWIFNTLLSVDMGFLTGNHRFTAIAVVTILTPFIKTLSTIVLVNLGYKDLLYAAIPLSIVIASIVSYIFVRMIPSSNSLKDENIKELLTFPTKYYWVTVLGRFSLVSYLTFDVLLAKHFLTPDQAGQYALIALIGKMIFFIGGLFNQFVVPLVSRELGENDKTLPSFKIIFFAAAFSSWIAYILFGIMGEVLGPILLGDKIAPVAYLLPMYGLGVFAFSIASSIVSYHIVRKTYVLAIFSFVFSVVQLVAISIFHSSIDEIVKIMTIVGVLNLICAVLIHFFSSNFITFFHNLGDFFFLLMPIPSRKPINKDKLRILIFNWRDTKHVWAGGAEAYIHGIAKKMVEKGHIVTIFSGNDKQSKRYEEIDGVQIIRRGGFYTVYIWAFIYYILKLRGNYDIIVDSVNGVPFFTPLYAGVPIVGVIHHVHQEVFRENLALPLALLACFLEANMMPMVYKKVKMITVSDSTRNAMKYIGFKNPDAIDIVYPGIDIDMYKTTKKTTHPSIVYLGRLKKYKSVDVVIEAMKEVVQAVPETKFIIAGVGEYHTRLKNLVNTLGLQNSVQFVGKIPEKLKSTLLAQSWIFVHPSFMEGWGITAIEASASGTAVIASNVPGLRDSVQDGKTGKLVQYGNVAQFSEAITKILKDKKLRQTFEKNGLEWAKRFSWENSADKMLEVLKNQI